MQDPAIAHETGLCVWQSGHKPVLDFKTSGSFLEGAIAGQSLHGLRIGGFKTGKMLTRAPMHSRTLRMHVDLITHVPMQEKWLFYGQAPLTPPTL